MQNAEAQKREHPRYAVSNLRIMKARFDVSSSQEQILTIGLGGCGFVGFDKTWQKADNKRITSVFELNLPNKVGPVRIQGDIIYIKPVTIGGRSMYYFGVQFLPSDVARMKPVIDALDALTKKGAVKLASA